MTPDPNPGSDEAVTLGCCCPRMDNHYGRSEPTPWGWWISECCKVHADVDPQTPDYRQNHLEPA